MFKTMFFKEIREHLMTFRFAAALVTTFVLILISFWVLGEDYKERQNDFNQAAKKLNEDMLARCYTPSMIAPVISRPPSPLRIFAEGEDRRHGNFITIERLLIP